MTTKGLAAELGLSFYQSRFYAASFTRTSSSKSG